MGKETPVPTWASLRCVLEGRKTPPYCAPRNLLESMGLSLSRGSLPLVQDYPIKRRLVV